MKINELATKKVFIPKGAKNIPRKKMPQIKSTLVAEFMKSLMAKKIKVSKAKVSVSKLKPTQKEINTEKVQGMIDNAPEKSLAKPIIMAKDFYILDGHHRWLALLNKDPKFTLDVWKVNLSIDELLKAAREFDKVSFKDIDETFNAL